MKKTNLALLASLALVVAPAAWLVHVPTTALADELPLKYHDTVRKGLEYLAGKQHKDGHWEGDDGKHPVAMTALVGVALLMERNGGEDDGPRSPMNANRGQDRKHIGNVLKAARWLMAQAKPRRGGLIFSEHASETDRYMEGHGLATLFLAGALFEVEGEERKQLCKILTRAVGYIVKSQSSRGGWYRTSKTEGHDFDSVRATVIQLQALEAARAAGIPVPKTVASEGQQYFKTALAKYDSKDEATNPSRPLETAAAVAGIPPPWLAPSPLPIAKFRDAWFKYCRDEIPAGARIRLDRDELTHYYYAQALCKGEKTEAILDEYTATVARWEVEYDRLEKEVKAGVVEPQVLAEVERQLLSARAAQKAAEAAIETWAIWTKYRTPTFDHLQSKQNKDGSWPGGSGEGLSVGAVYATAIWCTVLQLENNNYPGALAID